MGQFGGEAKMDSGFDYAASFLLVFLHGINVSGFLPPKVECGRSMLYNNV
jgi:hypothetical protein